MMNERKECKKLDGKDLINIGIFTAIYFVVVFAVAMLGMIPIFLILLTVFVPLVGGIIFELFLTKVKKFGMITIMGFLLGLIMLLTGMGYVPIVTGTLFGFLADFTYTKGKFASAKLAVLSNGFFSIWCWGTIMNCSLTRMHIGQPVKFMGKDILRQYERYFLPTWRRYCL